MSNPTTHAALRAHIERWRKRQRKQGMEHGPLGEQGRALVVLCEKLDALDARLRKLEKR